MTIKDFFQKPYNWFHYWQAPQWLKIILQQLNDDIIFILRECGQIYINYLKEQIIIAAQDSNMSGRQKLDYVIGKAKEGFTVFAVTLKDRQVNLLIEHLVSLLKKQGAI